MSSERIATENAEERNIKIQRISHATKNANRDTRADLELFGLEQESSPHQIRIFLFKFGINKC